MTLRCALCSIYVRLQCVQIINMYIPNRRSCVSVSALSRYGRTQGASCFCYLLTNTDHGCKLFPVIMVIQVTQVRTSRTSIWSQVRRRAESLPTRPTLIFFDDFLLVFRGLEDFTARLRRVQSLQTDRITRHIIGN